jgi:magnesium chelatase family protein
VEAKVAIVDSVAFQGISTIPVHVQVQMAKGMPSFQMVGLPDKAVSESRERIRGALSAIGLGLPPRRITVNLSPADLLKEGSHFDLAIGLGLLAVMDVISFESLLNYVVLGELSLDGCIVGVNGVLPCAMMAVERGKGLICPEVCGPEAMWAGDSEGIVAAPDILSLLAHMKGEKRLSGPSRPEVEDMRRRGDLSDIRGQYQAKRALEIAASGGHNLIMMGPPGSGKSMLAHRLVGILPPMATEEALEVSMIHSVAGMMKGGILTVERPFRDPHHTVSMPALVGGGHKARPGEVSLAHNGVLFLDELPEFSPATLDALRQPLESEYTLIARANHHVTYPARFQLVGAMNPCRCGYLYDRDRSCRRAPHCAEDYQRRLSGPFLDRMDLCVDVPEVDPRDLRLGGEGETSEEIGARVKRAREIQWLRYEGKRTSDGKAIRVNARVDGKYLEEVVQLEAKGQEQLDKAVDEYRFSARGYHRILRVARTIADMDEKETVSVHHISEALSLRRRGHWDR